MSKIETREGRESQDQSEMGNRARKSQKIKYHIFKNYTKATEEGSLRS